MNHAQLPRSEGISSDPGVTWVIEADHPLAEEIHAYQAERIRKLAQVNRGREPTRVTVKPRKKKKR